MAIETAVIESATSALQLSQSCSSAVLGHMAPLYAILASLGLPKVTKLK